MEPEQVRRRVAIALGLKMAIPNDQARVVGDAVLRVIQECGLITVTASELARVNELVRAGSEVNARLIAVVQECAGRFREYEKSHRAKGTPDADAKADRNRIMAETCERALGADEPIIEGELAPQGEA